MAQGTPSRDARASLLWAAVFLLVTVCALVPFVPVMPSEGLDASWSVAMNEAVAQGMAFGRDLVFTFGPYASVYTHVFHPATDARMLAASLALAVALAAVLSLLLRGTGWLQRVALVLVLSGLLYSRDALFVFYMVAAGALCDRLGREEAAADGRWPRVATLFVLFVPLGLLPLVKGSMLALAVVIAVLATVLCLLRRQGAMALAVVLGPCVGGATAWLLAGHPLAGLSDYVAAMLPIVSGYTDAMSSTGKPTEIVLYVMAALAIVWRLARREAALVDRIVLLLMFAAGLFLAFKGGFVRHDAHAGMAGLFLLLACCILPWPRGRVANVLAVALCVLAWGVIDRNHFGTTPAVFVQQAQRTYVDAWQGLLGRIAAPDALAAQYRAALHQIAQRAPFGRLEGSTDIYSHAQIELIAPGDRWDPRPVFQSYSAYTPELAERNRQHLTGPRAPDQVVFRVEPIDGRLPPQEDGPSWPELLARYQPADLKEDALLLRKRAGPASTPADCGSVRAEHAVGEKVQVPASECAAFVRIDLRPTFLGALAALFYKPSQLEILLDLADGTQRQYRLVAGMARAGLLLSPLVETGPDFGLLYAGLDQLGFKRVRTFTIRVRRPWMWHATYATELRGLRIAPQADVLRLYTGLEPARAAGEQALQPAPGGCRASLDVINGSSADRPFSAGRTLTARGWLGTAQGTSPAHAFLVLTDAAGKRFLVPTRRVPRGDVAGHFGLPSMTDSGFIASANVQALRGAFRLALGYEDQGRIFTCPEVDLPGVLSGAPS